MDIDTENKPREFFVGEKNKVVLKDCAKIFLDFNEQVTFITKDKKEYDICRKDWGFYATPSINGRLLQFGFSTALVENSNQLRYVWLIENGKEALFEKYLKNENHKIIQWLGRNTDKNFCICGMNDFKLIYQYECPPEGEMSYDLKGQQYLRGLKECKFCGHFLLSHDYDLEAIYSGQYSEFTYRHKLVDTFNKIIKLPEEKSDNCRRVKNIIDYCKKYFGDKKLSVLDVGSGLCVFLYLLSQKTNWQFLALDPDPIQAQHAEQICNIKSICADFNLFQSDSKFDLIAFNKVLEHVRNPIQFLSIAKNHLVKDGLVYIELPDGTEALNDSPLREEFFIEHYHAFSMASITLLIEKSGFKVLSIERLREPSGKYTLRVFCSAKEENKSDLS